VVCEPRVEQYTVPGPCYTKAIHEPGQCYVDPHTGHTCYKHPVTRFVTCQAPPQVCYRTVMVPRTVIDYVPVTYYVQQCYVEKVPYQVCKVVPIQTVKKVPYTVCKMVAEEQVRYVPVRRCRMVCEERVRHVPYTICKMVPQERTRIVKCQRTRMVEEECVRKIPVEICRMVEEECVKYVPVTICERVPVCTVERQCKRVRVCVPVVECERPGLLERLCDWLRSRVVDQSPL
jgi:hypothetical protein